MKFSLLTLNVTIATLLVLVFQYTEHGKLGMIYGVPHVAMIHTAYALYRRQSHRSAMFTIATYAICWVATHVCGNAAATQNANQVFSRSQPHGSVLLDHDPIREKRRTTETPRNWHYCDTPSAPCPFVVRHYVARAAGRMGTAETASYVWIPGSLYLWHTTLEWKMC
jgi:hypothetical protein